MSVLSDIFEVDTYDRTVQKLGEMNHARTQHACILIARSEIDEHGRKTYARAVLISGGVSVTNDSQTIVKEVELFVLDDKKSIDLAKKMEKPRFKHRMIQLGEEIFALGGDTEIGTTNSIEKFNFHTDSDIDSLNTGIWTNHPRTLRSSSTSDLTVAALPKDAVECNSEPCKCGKSQQNRIVGGTVVGSS